MKRVCALTVVLLMALSIFSGIPVLGKENSGTCGVNVNWSFDENTGTLTISGNGIIDDQCYYDLAWEDFREQITAVVVERGVQGIGQNAFYGLPNLLQVSLPEGLQNVDNCAFMDCSSLTSIEFPDSVWAFGDSVLSHCTSLTKVKLPMGIQVIPDALFRFCTSLTEFEIPDTVTKIGALAFSGTGLTEISVPGSVKSIDSEAFSGCVQLQSVQLSKGVEKFGVEVFSYCDLLKEMEFPATVRDISATMRSNSSLEKITFRGNLPIGADSLHQDLQWNENVTIYYPRNIKTWTEEIFSGFGDNVSFVGFELEEPLNPVIATGICGKSAVWSLTDEYVMTISGQGEIQDISWECWNGYDDQVKQIVIEDGITIIRSSAFAGFTSLEKVWIPETVTEICAYAFHNCESLTRVKVPQHVKSIGMLAFSGCKALARVDVLGNEVELGRNLFKGCENLMELHITGETAIFDEYAFHELTLTVYYPAGIDSWTQDVMQNYHGDVTWKICTEHEILPEPTATEPTSSNPRPEEKKEPMKLYWIVVIATSAVVAIGAVVTVLVIRRKRS